MEPSGITRVWHMAHARIPTPTSPLLVSDDVTVKRHRAICRHWGTGCFLKVHLPDKEAFVLAAAQLSGSGRRVENQFTGFNPVGLGEERRRLPLVIPYDNRILFL